MFEPPTQLVDWCCALEAVDAERNIARAYHIYASQDLFGHVIVALRWGRIGRTHSSITVSFSNEVAARKFIEHTLGKRASAPRRIGIAYNLVND
ncbi:WGR domain-containing protein [Sphingobium sp. TB-6]|uniref:WGR domain-containing protein n=1 Tax=Sphingobium sp. TB-6 TaxID=2728850 RepID=UPI00146C45DF|nr:WGR domain-containing protein [Sphingobium sp. TB-6]NML91308.1 WGR domain-containing protein [Sphingobium sp. TB-6]